MSKKRKKRANKNLAKKENLQNSSPFVPILDPSDVLDVMAECDKGNCFHGFCFSDPKRKNDYETIEWLIENLHHKVKEFSMLE